MFSSTIIIENSESLFLAIEPERKDLISSRASVEILKQNSSVIFNIKADDFASYRAMQSAIMRLLVTYYKILDLEE